MNNVMRRDQARDLTMEVNDTQFNNIFEVFNEKLQTAIKQGSYGMIFAHKDIKSKINRVIFQRYLQNRGYMVTNNNSRNNLFVEW